MPILLKQLETATRMIGNTAAGMLDSREEVRCHYTVAYGTRHFHIESVIMQRARSLLGFGFTIQIIMDIQTAYRNDLGRGHLRGFHHLYRGYADCAVFCTYRQKYLSEYNDKKLVSESSPK